MEDQPMEEPQEGTASGTSAGTGTAPHAVAGTHDRSPGAGDPAPPADETAPPAIADDSGRPDESGTPTGDDLGAGGD